MDPFDDDLEKDASHILQDLSLFEDTSTDQFNPSTTPKRSDTSASEDFELKRELYHSRLKLRQPSDPNTKQSFLQDNGNSYGKMLANVATKMQVSNSSGGNNYSYHANKTSSDYASSQNQMCPVSVSSSMSVVIGDVDNFKASTCTPVSRSNNGFDRNQSLTSNGITPPVCQRSIVPRESADEGNCNQREEYPVGVKKIDVENVSFTTVSSSTQFAAPSRLPVILNRDLNESDEISGRRTPDMTMSGSYVTKIDDHSNNLIQSQGQGIGLPSYSQPVLVKSASSAIYANLVPYESLEDEWDLRNRNRTTSPATNSHSINHQTGYKTNQGSVSSSASNYESTDTLSPIKHLRPETENENSMYASQRSSVSMQESKYSSPPGSVIGSGYGVGRPHDRKCGSASSGTLVSHAYLASEPSRTCLATEPSRAYLASESPRAYLASEPSRTYHTSEPSRSYIAAESSRAYLASEPTRVYTSPESSRNSPYAPDPRYPAFSHVCSSPSSTHYELRKSTVPSLPEQKPSTMIYERTSFGPHAVTQFASAPQVGTAKLMGGTFETDFQQSLLQNSLAHYPPPPPYPGHKVGSPFSPVSRNCISPNSRSNALNSKTLLPYSVTPPRPMGPSEAEKKIEELTRQLEEEMENCPEGEFFGE